MQEKNKLWGDRITLKTIFEKVKRLSMRFTAHDVVDADDVVQNAMVKLLLANSLGRNNHWLTQVVQNCATDSLRKAAREKKYNSYYGNDLAKTIDGRRSWLTRSELERFAESDDLGETLKKLSPEARQVIYLLADDYTYEEIARSTKVKLGTVRSRVFYARVQAKRLLSS